MFHQNLPVEPFTVCFFGHRYVDGYAAVERLLEKELRKLFETHQILDLLVGRNGEFDQMASSTVRRIKAEDPACFCTLTLVLPYRSAEYRNNAEYFENYYDDIEFCMESCAAHYKRAIQIRNRAIVDRSDLVICYITNPTGGAYQTIRYAELQGKDIIRLDMEEQQTTLLFEKNG